jgi:hypothetical protein
LIGSIPTILGKLTALASLTLGKNELTGSIPFDIGELTALTYLYLSHNDLTGVIPETLTRLTKLETLFLNGNSMKLCFLDAATATVVNDKCACEFGMCPASHTDPCSPASGQALCRNGGVCTDTTSLLTHYPRQFSCACTPYSYGRWCQSALPTASPSQTSSSVSASQQVVAAASLSPSTSASLKGDANVGSTRDSDASSDATPALIAGVALLLVICTLVYLIRRVQRQVIPVKASVAPFKAEFIAQSVAARAVHRAARRAAEPGKSNGKRLNASSFQVFKAATQVGDRSRRRCES